MLAALLIVLNALNCLAQDSSYSKKKQRKPPMWDTIAYRNEVSADFSPLLAPLAEMPNIFSHAGFFYKRYVHHAGLIRAGVKMGYEYRNSAYISYQSLRPNQTVDMDTFLHFSKSKHRVLSPALHIGYEYRLGKRRIKFVIGADIFAGAQVTRSGAETTKYDKYAITDTVTGYYLVGYKQVNSEPARYNLVNVSALMGISPFAGFYAHITKRLSITAQCAYSFKWLVGLTPARDKGHVRTLIDKTGFSTDISLVCLF
jgi:hypothetical protein